VEKIGVGDGVSPSSVSGFVWNVHFLNNRLNKFLCKGGMSWSGFGVISAMVVWVLPTSLYSSSCVLSMKYVLWFSLHTRLICMSFGGLFPLDCKNSADIFSYHVSQG